MNILMYNLGLLLLDSIRVDFILFLWLLWQDNCHLESAAAVIYLLQTSQKPSKGKLVFFYSNDGT